MITQQLNKQGNFDTWPQARVDELKSETIPAQVGTRLIFQDASIRVWEIRLQPGERLLFTNILLIIPGWH